MYWSQNQYGSVQLPGSSSAGRCVQLAIVDCIGHMSPPPSDVMMPPAGVPGWTARAAAVRGAARGQPEGRAGAADLCAQILPEPVAV